MHIVCPNCAATYQVGASAIGAAGRQVRCVRCRTLWHQKPQAEVPPLIMSSGPAVVREPVSDTTVAAFQSELGQAAEPPAEAAAAEAAANAEASGPSPNDSVEPGTADAPAEESTSAAEAAGAEAAEVSSAEAAPPVAPAIDDAAPPEPPPSDLPDIETLAARRRKRSTARRRTPMRFGPLPIAITVLIGIVAALIGWRGSIVRNAPQMASLYAAIGLPVNLRGLAFTEVRVARDTHDGVPVLVVEGAIASAASRPVEVPRLRFAMRNEAGGEVYAWTAMPPREVLEPGETMAFRSRLASPPSEGHDVTVRFFTRHDAAAGLR